MTGTISLIGAILFAIASLIGLVMMLFIFAQLVKLSKHDK